MSVTSQNEVVVCPANEVCTNVGCKAEIIAKSLGGATTKLIVSCEQNFGFIKESPVEEYDFRSLASDFAQGDDIARIYVVQDAPVCSGYGVEEISNPHILFNGRPVVNNNPSF